jgi:hypothetical protein
MDISKNAHIITWFNLKNPRVMVIVLTAETLAVAAPIDTAYAVQI